MIEQRLYGAVNAIVLKVSNAGAESIYSKSKGKSKSKSKEVIKRLSGGLPGKQSAEAGIYYFHLGDLVLRHQDG